MKLSAFQVLSFLFVIFSQAFTDSALASLSKVQQGDRLIQSGLKHLNQNQSGQALQDFAEAHSIYKDSNHSPGINRALINESVALEQIGQYYRACTTLTKVLSLNYKICQSQSEEKLTTLEQNAPGLDTNQRIAALHNLGNNLQILGQLESSEVVFKQALSLDSKDRPDIQLSLANTYQSKYKNAINQLSISTDPVSEAEATNKAQAHAQEAIALYKSIVSSQSQSFHAQLNTLQLLLHLGSPENPKFIQLYQESQHLIQPFISDLISMDFSQFNDADAVNLQLKLSGLLNELEKPTEAFNHARAALIKADTLQDYRLRSQAYGTLGKIYLKSEQRDDAIKIFNKALKLAQASKEDSLAYQWSWQIAQIHQQSGNRTQAIAAYNTTLQHLDSVRTLIVSANSDLQFSYKDSVEPVYHQYLQLLLSSPTPDFRLVLETHQQLQVAELENFLKCSKLDAVNVDNPQSSQQANRIHIFKLGEQIEVIAQTQQGFYRHQPDSVAVSKDINNFLRLLDGQLFKTTPKAEIQKHSQAVYQQLLGPIQPQLPASGSLVFHLDSHFQNLPMALLHDGQTYLIKKYNIQTALDTKLRPIRSKGLDQVNVLFAGLSETSPSFKQPNVPNNLSPLPDVEAELEGVAESSNLKFSLLNGEFTSDRLQSAISQDTGILHIASHGQFSSDPQKTFLLAYNKPINARQFHDLLNQKNEIGQASLELLILSACQTAKGDRRSALGIAGLAIQAGSKNILATLWLANSKSTTKLITYFYQGLANDMTKAEALQHAQIKLMKSQNYSHPYYWSNFVLVGS